ncbi:MAG: sortase [Anaerolineae bacterium]|nr:sortase [Anaerolineae bacterium]MEB2287374.1 sortase [Anaerolineae bacterium]
MLGSPKKRRLRFTPLSCSMLSVEFIVLIFAVWRLSSALLPATSATATPPRTPPPQGLRPEDVLPTPTPDRTVPVRQIMFPAASVGAPIIPAGRVRGTWETRHLGDSVGHLVGTAWLDDSGGNIVLAGHVESFTGAPGPFAYLFEAKLGDLVVLREGAREERYRVTQIEDVDPYDVSWLAQDGVSRITLITCTDWDFDAETYLGRLVVVAEPVVMAAQSSSN